MTWCMYFLSLLREKPNYFSFRSVFEETKSEEIRNDPWHVISNNVAFWQV